MASTIVVDKIQKTGGVAFTLPVADGATGQYLKTDGSLNLGWATDADTGILSVAADTSPQLGGDLDCDGSQIQWSKGADVASATALVLLTDGNYFDVTGTVTITSFNTTGGPGTQIKLHFIAACTLTHHGTDLKLPGGANILTAAGDVAEFIEYAAGDYICTSYTRASGKAVIASHSSTIGLATMWVPAVAMYPTTTTGCNALAQVEITAIKPEIKSLDFPVAADSYAQFGVAFPKSWDRLLLQYQTYWSVTGTNAGTVQFAMEAVAVSSDDPFGATFGTVVPNVALAASGTADDLMVSAVSGDLTVGGTPLEGDQVIFQIYRDISGGPQTADARLHGVKIFFTTNAENDA